MVFIISILHKNMAELRRYKREELVNMTLEQIKELIEDYNLHTTYIEGYSKMRKDELVTAFMTHHVKLLIIPPSEDNPNGTYYGYPTCCSTWFWKERINNHNFELTELQEKYTQGGFIPCHTCCEKLEKNNETIDSLIHNRICPLQFPKSPSMKVCLTRIKYSESVIYNRHKS